MAKGARSQGMSWPGVLLSVLWPFTTALALIVVIEIVKFPFVVLGMLF